MNKLNIIKTSNSWIEGSAVLQLQNSSNLEYMKYVCGMPDLHPGKGYPVGASFVSHSNYIYPYLIGSDIGCGMRLDILTDLTSDKIKLEKTKKQLMNLEKIKLPNILQDDEEFGFVGGGNHFVEVLKIKEILIEQDYLNKNSCLLMSHSGSRGLGHQILSSYIDKNKSNPVNVNSDLGNWYLSKHEQAIIWAKKNRDFLSKKASFLLGTESKNILDIYHNFVEPYQEENDTFIHRKGAASSFNDLVVIPGSRGDYSYLVKPIASDISLFSLPHGAGRKWQRNNCKCMLEDKYSAKSLEKTNIGSFVICEDKDLLYEEAPQAYKKISSVINDCLEFNLLEVVAIMQPIVTYKFAK